MFPGSPFDLVVVAASAGGLPAANSVFAQLPAHFPIPVAYVQHLSARHPSQLSEILQWTTWLPVTFAEHRGRLRAGTVVIAPPGRHLVVGPRKCFELDASAKQNFVRPAADRLFCTAAEFLGSRVLAVVLTGMGRDGALGARAIRESGGMVLVQDPREAEAPSMPQATLNTSGADLVLPLEGIASALNALTLVRGSRELFTSANHRLSA